jgi:hypothetical protein
MQVWIVSILFIFAFACTILPSLEVSLATDNSHSTPLVPSTMITNATAECAKLANQNIVFGNIHLIQALRDLADNNRSGALDQLSLAVIQLDKAAVQLKC